MHKLRRRWLRWIGITAVGLVLLASGLYAYLTRPARLRALALEALRDLQIPGLDVGSLRFSLWDGLEIGDLVVASRYTGGSMDHRPPWLQVNTAKVRCDLWPLLRGRVRPQDVRVDEAFVALVWDAADTGESPAEEAGADAGRIWRLLAASRVAWPTLLIERLDVQLVVREQSYPRTLERRVLRCEGRRDGDEYVLRLDRAGGSNESLARACWQPRSGELGLVVDWLPLTTVARFLPRRIAGALRELELAGRLRLEQVRLRTRGSGDAPAAQPELLAATLQLADFEASLAVEENQPGAPAAGAADRFLRVTGAKGAVQYRAASAQEVGRLDLSLDGQLNGAPLKLSVDGRAQLLGRLWPRAERQAAGPAGDQPAVLDLVRRADLSVVGLELPTVTSHPRFVSAQRLPGAVRAAFGDYQPHGRVDLRLSLLPVEQAGADPQRRLAGQVEARGAGCRYFRFPYGFEDAQGRLRFEDGRILLEELCARHGSARVCVSGTLASSQEWTGFDLVFEGQRVPLDGSLYQALPEQFQQLWQTAAPIGLCDIVTRIHRDEGSEISGPLPPEISVTAKWLGGSLSLGAGRRLEQVDGAIVVAGNRVDLEDLHGYDGDAGVRLRGTVTAAATSESDVHVEVANLMLDEQAQLPTTTATTQPATPVRFVGRADLWGRVWTSAAGDGHGQCFAVHIKDGELRGLDASRRWTASRGWVVVRDDRRDIVEFTCRQGDAEFALSGVWPDASRPEATLSLDVQAQGGALQEVVPQFVPPEWSQIAAAIGLSGAGRVRVHLRPDTESGRERQAVGVEVQAARMRATAVPLPLEQVTAQLDLKPGRFELWPSTARWGPHGTLEAEGHGTWHGTDVEADLSLVARGMEFCQEFNAGLPGPIASLLEKLTARGSFDALLHRIRLISGQSQVWQFEGHIPLRDCALRLGLALTEASGDLSGSCRIGPEGAVDLLAEIDLRRGKLAGRPLTDWRGQLRRQPGDRWVRLDDLHGQLCDGEARGQVLIDPKTGDYELTLTLKDVSAAGLLSPERGQSQRERPGRIDGAIHLRGRGSEIASRRGGGDLRMRGGSFLQTPILESVSTARRAEQGAMSDDVEQADARFLWEGSLIHFRRMEIRSRDLRLVGEGTWDMRDDTVRMSFWGSNPDQWPRAGKLGEWLERAGKSLVQYRVEGALDRPKVTAEPLHQVNDTLRALLRGGEE